MTAQSESVGVQSVDTPATPATPSIPTAPVLVAGGGGGAVPGGVPVPIEPPTVVFGNGRTPRGVLSAGRPGVDAPAVVPAPVGVSAPEAPLAPIVIAPTPPTAIPAPRVDSPFPWVFSEIWSPVGPGRNNNALFGLAGLILIPLAGVWLGYRQAMAARAAANLAQR